ncbi:hypothetical protein I7I53_10980 [Histoplasma capsulatum var. duboisii H88]|uniref:Uncharacterized protein n=1 Tax=Ajellomyces capsulatus (strain H88) TaxID=544711 RepID=A0A8A1L9M7_AJEC8|nr:hypothetical protein I7I53_10980 [Histoplasma capsulatum var. duboisii H88]
MREEKKTKSKQGNRNSAWEFASLLPLRLPLRLLRLLWAGWQLPRPAPCCSLSSSGFFILSVCLFV